MPMKKWRYKTRISKPINKKGIDLVSMVRLFMIMASAPIVDRALKLALLYFTWLPPTLQVTKGELLELWSRVPQFSI